MIELSERLLNDAGGWQVMKEARGLHQAGRVLSASYEPPLLQGRVRQGETEFRAGLRILSRSNIENLCGCRDSKQRGMICAHSLAVGIAILKPLPASLPPAPTPAPAPVAPAKPEIFSVDGPGTPTELFLVLAPNFSAAWERNSITLGAEISVGSAGRRILLSALDQTGRYRCTPADLRVILKLRELADGELPGMAVLPRAQWLQLLGALGGHPRVTLGKTVPVKIETAGILPKLHVYRLKDGAARLRAEVPGEGTTLAAPGAEVWRFSPATNTFVPVAPGLPAAYQTMLHEEILIPAAGADQFLARELPTLAAFFEIDPTLIPPAIPMPALPATDSPGTAFFLKLEGSLNFLAAELECRRGERRTAIGGAGYRGGNPEESAALEILRRAGFNGPDAKGQLMLKGEPLILSFFARDLPRLQKQWTVRIGERFEHITRDVARIEPRLEIRSSSQNWFELNVELGTPGGDRFSSADIQRLLQSGRSSVRLKNGKLGVFNADLLDEFQSVLRDCAPTQDGAGHYRIKSQHAAYVEGVANEHGIALDAPEQWRQSATAPRRLDKLSAIPLDDLEEVLRPYQKQGVYWLHFLAQNGWGGILADEMGLGKTVQMLAFLRTLKSRALVVCPSSLIFNWQREAARFAPELKVLAIAGPRRHESFSQISQADLVITSYPLLRRDAERYRGVRFAAMVLDEAQHIKNPDSQNAQAAQTIDARHRFVLTGTPIENSVRDIWSIMNFVMPDYLGKQSDFKERFEAAISRDPGGPEQSRLVQRLKPFILRRLKKNVAPELPDKIEQVAYCELAGAQLETYQKLADATRREVSQLAGSKDKNKARMLMLTALLRLRQACCDLRLLGIEGTGGEDSAKLELLEELLQEALDGGHRVIVFSQFVSMLHLIRDQLTAAETPYCYLDGSTTNRQAEVDRFQTGEVPVFLMSLKAGGVGLNLTAADTVIHFDPWWNPAVEAQATDRAHRIGQKSVVTAYKLIARNTVEEKILALQARKRDLVNATIENEQPLMDGLTTADIEALIL